MSTIAKEDIYESDGAAVPAHKKESDSPNHPDIELASKIQNTIFSIFNFQVSVDIDEALKKYKNRVLNLTSIGSLWLL